MRKTKKIYFLFFTSSLKKFGKYVPLSSQSNCSYFLCANDNVKYCGNLHLLCHINLTQNSVYVKYEWRTPINFGAGRTLFILLTPVIVVFLKKLSTRIKPFLSKVAGCRHGTLLEKVSIRMRSFFHILESGRRC